MNLHRAAAAVVIPLAASIHAFGYYSVRSMAWRQGIDHLQLDISTLTTAMSMASTAGFFGMIAAVVFGALAGAPATAGVGVLLAAIGAVIQAFSWSTWGFGAGLAITGFGVGMYRPALIVSALRPFGANKQAARLVLLLVIYASTNLASIPSSLVGSLASSFGSTAITLVILLGAACSGAAALLFFGLASSGFVGVTQLEGSISGKHLVSAAVAVVIGGAGFAAWTFASDLQWAAMGDMFGGSSAVFYINPVVNVGACLTFATAFGMSQLAGWRPSAMAVAGGGMICAAMGLFPSIAVEYVGMPLVLLCVVVGAIGEGLLWAGLMAAAAADLHWRIAMIPAAMLTATTASTNMISQALGYYSGTSAGFGATVLAAAVGISGLLLLGAALPLRSWMADEPDEADGKVPPGVDPYGFSDVATTVPKNQSPDTKSP